MVEIVRGSENEFDEMRCPRKKKCNKLALLLLVLFKPISIFIVIRLLNFVLCCDQSDGLTTKSEKNLEEVKITSNETMNVTLEQTESLRAEFEIFEVDRKPIESGRSYVCVPLFRIFNLEVRFKLGPNEVVAVSGDHAALGQWQIGKSLTLKPQNSDRSKWRLRKWICATQRLYYRYFIYEIDGRGQKQVRQWEGQQTPRMLQTYEMYHGSGVDVFGEAYDLAEGGGVQRERGWLRHEYVIELKFIWRGHINLVRSNSNEKEAYLLRLESLNWKSVPGVNGALIEVSRYAYNRSQFRPQPVAGVRYSAGGSVVIFRITQPLKTKNAFKLLISDLSSREIGEAFILPLQLRGSYGILQLPIHSRLNNFRIGQLILPYLVVHPMSESASINLRSSFHHYWPLNWPTMDVGHRGLGASYYHPRTTHVENTIKSFLAVPKVKGDMVEFDVVLTRDYVPVVWHGFGFYTAPAETNVMDQFDVKFVLIKDLSYEELKSSRVFIIKQWGLQEFTHLNVKNVTCEERIFPTLAEVYQSLPKTLGLVIEIKWPQLMERGLLESRQTLNKNRFVNELLETTVKFGCGRALIFTSMDADICTMVRLKQNAFPVMLMTAGRSIIWDRYMDLRTQTFRNAVNFAESTDILGTSTHLSNFLLKSNIFELGFNLNQVVFVWGHDLRNEQVLEHFRSLDVSGLIYDQMDLSGPKSWKRESFFTATELLEIFARQCVTSGEAIVIPGIKPPKPTIWPKL